MDRDKSQLFIDEIENTDLIEEMRITNREWEEADYQWRMARKNHDYNAHHLWMILQEKIQAKNNVHDKIATDLRKLAEETGVIIEQDLEYVGEAKVNAKTEELSPEWLMQRNNGIGGSELSSALGFHYTSEPGKPVLLSPQELEYSHQKLIEKKINPFKPESQMDMSSGILYRGHQWEPVMIARYGLLSGRKVGVTKYTYLGQLPFQQINIDGMILDNSNEPEALLECKTSSRKWNWAKGIPIGYRMQILWYLEATQLDYAVLIVHFDDGTFNSYKVCRGETIDGTTATKPITKYYGQLEDLWERVMDLKSIITKENYDDILYNVDRLDSVINNLSAISGESKKIVRKEITDLDDGEKVIDAVDYFMDNTDISDTPYLSMDIEYLGDLDQPSSFMPTQWNLSGSVDISVSSDEMNMQVIIDAVREADIIILNDRRIVECLEWQGFSVHEEISDRDIVDMRTWLDALHDEQVVPVEEWWNIIIG